jgi:hypothetical protein
MNSRVSAGANGFFSDGFIAVFDIFAILPV